MLVYELSAAALAGASKLRVDALTAQCFREPPGRAADSLVLCQDRGELLGLAFLTRAPGTLTVSGLCTRYGSRRAGVARAVMDYVEAENPRDSLLARVKPTEAAALNLFRGRGYVEVVEDGVHVFHRESI